MDGFDLSRLEECEWQWGASEKLLRNEPNLEMLDFEYPNKQLDLWGVDYVQGGGRCTFALVYPTDTEEYYLLVETRDYELADDGETVRPGPDFPIWENARIVPDNYVWMQPVWAILTDMHAS